MGLQPHAMNVQKHKYFLTVLRKAPVQGLRELVKSNATEVAAGPTVPCDRVATRVKEGAN